MIDRSPLLELTDIRKLYQSGETTIAALDGVSLTIWPGEFIAIMGQSGSGKSTLMNIIGCLDRPSDGSYRIMGREVAGLEKDELAELRRETFGFIFQRYNLLATATAEENIEIPAIYAGTDRPARVLRARQLLQQLGLPDRADHRPSQLSGGQQQRVAIARALINDPPVILADEPTGALDSKSGKEVMELLRELHRQGRTVILITHDENVAQNAKRIIRIHDGKISDDIKSDISDQNASMPQRKAKNSGGGIMPEISSAAKMALRSLRVNIFRTALTLLGIIIGVAAVVTMLAVGSGSKQKVLDQISAMGTNVLSIRPGAPGVRGSGDIATLTPDDAAAILNLPNVEAVSPERGGRNTLRYGNIDYMTTVQGVGQDFPLIRDWPIAAGHFFNERDIRSYAPVAVMGQSVVKNLFPDGSNPVGQYILVRNVPFEIIGVMNAKGASSFGNDQDDAIFIPYTTGLIRLFGKSYINGISIKVANTETIDETQESIRQLLISRHRTEDFSIRNSASILETATDAQNTLTVLLGAVAAISLLVGGIGVMNIMLVSVTERTREIGIRMATGARMRDILLQFNTEAAVICILGGLLGVTLGFLAGWILRFFNIAVVFSPLPALLAFSCAFATGLIFGYLPARKAAQLDPVIALSAE